MNIFEKQKETQDKLKKSVAKIKHLVAVGSGKGGVGKSTVAVNIAISLAKLGFKVGLADVDIYGPSIPTLFNIENQEVAGREIEGKIYLEPIEKFGIKLMSIGFFVDNNKALIWRGPMASNTIVQLISDTLWDELDYLIFDMPPGTGDIQLTILKELPISGVIFVSTPQELAVADVRRAINMIKNKDINIPILGLVENMAFFTPKELPNNKYYIFGKNGTKNLIEELSLDLLEEIPITEDISLTNDSGNPISLDNEALETKHFLSLAKKINNKLNI
ncbi:MAG: Mrp/NBP35 family ATP-binding protein [Bacteroidales bacterium]|nr:Mrp/NBP35 family ATP-binding protein [Bacteroidales bacterium]